MGKISNLVHPYSLSKQLFYVGQRIICNLQVQCGVDNSISQYCIGNKYLGTEAGRTEEYS